MSHAVYWDAIEFELKLPFGRVQVARGSWSRPIDTAFAMPCHHLELTLLPHLEGNPQACFPEHWPPDQFEPCGSMFFLPATQWVHFRSQCRHQKSVICEFDPAAGWFQHASSWRGETLKNLLNIANTRIRSLLFQIFREVSYRSPERDTMIELLVQQVAIELTRHMRAIEEDESLPGGLESWRLRLIDDRLEEQVTTPSLSELAELCDLSVRQLGRAFRVSREISLGNYIAQQNANHAKRLLASGMSIKSVAYTLGFSAPSNFTTAFTRQNGETPTQYQHRLKHSHG